MRGLGMSHVEGVCDGRTVISFPAAACGATTVWRCLAAHAESFLVVGRLAPKKEHLACNEAKSSGPHRAPS